MPQALLESARVAAAPSPGNATGEERRASMGVWIGRTAAALLGLVLLVAVYAKAIDPAAFAAQLETDGLTFGLSPMAVALAALAVEAALGLLLVLGVRRWWSLTATAAVVVLFLVVTAHGWWVSAHGGPPPAGCGCFGNLVQRSPRAAFLEDALLFLPLLALAFVARDRAPRQPLRRLAVAAVGVLAVVLFAWRAPALPLDDLATRLKPGVDVRTLCAGEGTDRVCLPDADSGLTQGRTWVVLADLAQAQTFVTPLNDLLASPDAVPVHLLTTASPDDVRAFTWQWGPSFEIHEAPPALLRPLYRSLPRSFLVADGRVVRTVSGLPPRGASPGDPKR